MSQVRSDRAGLTALRLPAGRTIPLLLTAGLVLGMVAACLLLMDIGRAVLRALPALPAAIAVHLLQLAATAMAWRGAWNRPRPGFALMPVSYTHLTLPTN